MKYSIQEGNYLTMGATLICDTITFTFEAEQECDCAVVLYPKNRKEEPVRIAIPSDYCVGSLRSVAVKGISWKRYDYVYEIDGILQNDPYARRIIGREKWADLERAESNYRICSGFDFSTFPWTKEKKVCVKKQDMVMYKLHVRAYTMSDPAVRGKKKGTFRAIQEKIPYLKEFGITTLELMPVYEFEEFVFEKEKPTILKKAEDVQHPKRINLWGYEKGEYFAPKASYAYTNNPAKELKELILALHAHDIECVLEMYFEPDMNPNMILEVLRYWVMEYHVDGFHLLGVNLSLEAIVQDVRLSRTKLFYHHFPEELQNEKKQYQNLYEYNDDFYYPVRRMMNRMEGELESLTGQMRKQRLTQGYINYITSNNGFTLADLFSFGEKHNWENGEENLDGNNWNYSNNYGEEGPSRKKFINSIRKRQMMNAMAIVLLSQGVPMIWAGDEIGNSQSGNNNAYCQDNVVGWTNWKQKDRYCEFTMFVKKMLEFRKEHPILRKEVPFHLCDDQQLGYPDLSYHCDAAWVTRFEVNRLSIGIMYCGKGEAKDDDTVEKIYVGINFHNGSQTLALPQLGRGEVWCKIMDTTYTGNRFFPESEQKNVTHHLQIPGQSVCILLSRPYEKKEVVRSPKIRSIRAAKENKMRK